ncbi:MAG: hypothetical protein FJ098_16305 [Deltaproteobacteria bacterium]|nr:hypothetical protein [Deltaproteobacteria bacterium]
MACQTSFRLLFTVLLAVACVETEPLAGKACDASHPCPGAMTCRGGTCEGAGAPACDEDGDCPLGGHCFLEGGYCVSCLLDEHCGVGVCHPLVHVCVGCLEDADCPVGVCLPKARTCVDCRTDGDCDTGLCQVELHVCLGCKGHHQCRSGTCDLATGVCAPPEG